MTTPLASPIEAAPSPSNTPSVASRPSSSITVGNTFNTSPEEFNPLNLLSLPPLPLPPFPADFILTPVAIPPLLSSSTLPCYMNRFHLLSDPNHTGDTIMITRARQRQNEREKQREQEGTKVGVDKFAEGSDQDEEEEEEEQQQEEQPQRIQTRRASTTTSTSNKRQTKRKAAGSSPETETTSTEGGIAKEKQKGSDNELDEAPGHHAIHTAYRVHISPDITSQPAAPGPKKDTPSSMLSPSASLAAELAQARKEEGQGEYAGEIQQQAASLQAPVQQPTHRHPPQPLKHVEVRTEPTHMEERKEPIREQEEHEEELKEETPLSAGSSSICRSQDEEKQRLTASSKAAPIEEKEQPYESFSDLLPPTSLSISPTRSVTEKQVGNMTITSPFESHPTVTDDETLWKMQLSEYEQQQEEIPSRSIWSFIAHLSYQPPWLRLLLTFIVLINVVFPILFIHHTYAVITLCCQCLVFLFSYYLYLHYDMTSTIFYAFSLLLPSLCYIAMDLFNESGWRDLWSVMITCISHPSLLFDEQIIMFLWCWSTSITQAICIIGATMLAIRGR